MCRNECFEVACFNGLCLPKQVSVSVASVQRWVISIGVSDLSQVSMPPELDESFAILEFAFQSCAMLSAYRRSILVDWSESTVASCGRFFHCVQCGVGFWPQLVSPSDF